MILLSLFNGIGVGNQALKELGIEVEVSYVSEIDKFANATHFNNHPDSIQLGDVTKYQGWDIDWGSIDLVTAGFPCQAWSVAGKQLGDKDPRGMLFWTTLDIIAKVLKYNPNAKWMLENVKMKEDFEKYITKHTEDNLGEVFKVLLNSANVVPQLRTRYFWTNLEIPPLGGTPTTLVDIYEEPYLDVPNLSATKGGLSYALTANYSGAVAWNSCERKQRTMVPVELTQEESPNVYKGVRYRKLTPIECERLQGLPDNYTKGVSNTQRYKQLGNTWTLPVIKHIFKSMLI